MLEVFIGFDPREKRAFDVCVFSVLKHTSEPIKITGIYLEKCKKKRLLWREQFYKGNQFWDKISNAPCSTEFAISRFLTPHLAHKNTEWALFMDCDMLFVSDIMQIMKYADNSKAVVCTKHKHRPLGDTKMDNQVQTNYGKKNWSSVCLFNCKHPSNKKLTLDMINEERGLNLHQFCWLEEDEIGSLPLSFNHLVGYNPPHGLDGRIIEEYRYETPINIHFTSGMPFMRGYENCEFSKEWEKEEEIMLMGRIKIETN